MTDLLNGDGELKAEIEYNLRRIEQEEEERKHSEVVEAAEAVENRGEDENRNLEVLTTSPEEICEQLQSLIVQLSRCDDTMATSTPGSAASKKGPEVALPFIRLTKCDKVAPVATPVSEPEPMQTESPPAERSENDDRVEAESPAAAVTASPGSDVAVNLTRVNVPAAVAACDEDGDGDDDEEEERVVPNEAVIEEDGPEEIGQEQFSSDED